MNSAKALTILLAGLVVGAATIIAPIPASAIQIERNVAVPIAADLLNRP